ncbi:hypothetical protein [Pseudosulfitobacter pseudonitzschiae]|uniref:hypothetical protein n=1 Tax=Pseudosulfitobacter pseudonitzschiae TaxID=1402135 RepID=UPI003B7CE18F
MALFGVGWAVSFDLGVRLYGAEIVSVFGLMLVQWKRLPAQYPMLKKIISAYALWVLAIGLSDLVNGTALFDSARHMATPIIGTALLVFVVAAFSRKPTAILTFLAATAIAKALFGDAAYGETFSDQALTWTNINADTNIFKVRLAPSLTPALLILACWAGSRSLLRGSLVLFIASIGYFAMDARSHGLIFFFSATSLVFIHIGFKPRVNQIIVAGLLGSCVGYVSYIGYVEYTLAYNPNGHNGKQLLRLENPYNPLELLLTGRLEWLVWPIAFAERPLFGWGSWAEDPDGRFTFLKLALLNTGTSAINAVDAKVNYIPVHSLIGAAFVWSGLLGLFAIVWFLRVVLAMGRRLLLAKSYLLPAAIFLFYMLIWHFLFSPPQHVRLSFPVALGSLIVLTSQIVDQRRIRG